MSRNNLYGIPILFAFPIVFFGILQLPFALNSSAPAPFESNFDEAIVFFGFTSCPSVCPTTLSQLASAKEKSSEPTLPVIFINTSEGITDESAHSYAQSFHSSFTGIQWPPGGKTEFETKFNIKLAGQLDSPNNHSTELFVISKHNSEWVVKKIYKAHPPQIKELIKLLQGEGTLI